MIYESCALRRLWLYNLISRRHVYLLATLAYRTVHRTTHRARSIPVLYGRRGRARRDDAGVPAAPGVGKWTTRCTLSIYAVAYRAKAKLASSFSGAILELTFIYRPGEGRARGLKRERSTLPFGSMFLSLSLSDSGRRILLPLPSHSSSFSLDLRASGLVLDTCGLSLSSPSCLLRCPS